MAAQASHLLALDGMRISWARRAVQICIGSDANLISTIVAKKSIGGTHLADFTTVFRHAGDLDPVLRRPDSNRDSHERACFRPRLYRRRGQNVEKVLNVARSERGSIVDTCHGPSFVLRGRRGLCSGAREDRACRCFIGSLSTVG